MFCAISSILFSKYTKKSNTINKKTPSKKGVLSMFIVFFRLESDHPEAQAGIPAPFPAPEVDSEVTIAETSADTRYCNSI
jgi:hypothetical protein